MTLAAQNLRRSDEASANARSGTVLPLARLQRASGAASVAFKLREERSVLGAVHQAGCCKLRFPRPLPGGAPEAVLINTAGGLTDGDQVETHALWHAGTRAVVTTQAAERVYRSRGAPAHIHNRLQVDEGAHAFWLPQETILFDGGRFDRRLDADIADGGNLLACEATLFGRTAMGETVHSGSLFDSWRVRYDDKLVYADAIRLDGDIQASLNRPALAGRAAAIASLIQIGPVAEQLLEPVRDALASRDSLGGCSLNGPVLFVRMLAACGSALRRDLSSLLDVILDRVAAAGEGGGQSAILPRVWSC